MEEKDGKATATIFWAVGQTLDHSLGYRDWGRWHLKPITLGTGFKEWRWRPRNTPEPTSAEPTSAGPTQCMLWPRPGCEHPPPEDLEMRCLELGAHRALRAAAAQGGVVCGVPLSFSEHLLSTSPPVYALALGPVLEMQLRTKEKPVSSTQRNLPWS